MKYHGVQQKSSSRFVVYTTVNGSARYVGSYADAIEAARAADNANYYIRLRSARPGRRQLNFPDDYSGDTPPAPLAEVLPLLGATANAENASESKTPRARGLSALAAELAELRHRISALESVLHKSSEAPSRTAIAMPMLPTAAVDSNFPKVTKFKPVSA